MNMETVIAELTELVPKENILVNEPMKKHTTFRIGGEAACFVQIENEDQLAAVWKCLQKKQVPVLILGNGSNLLVSDEGFQGVVLEICDKMNAIRVEGTKIVYDGYFHESEYRSAPYFDATIDGIELLNSAF